MRVPSSAAAWEPRRPVASLASRRSRRHSPVRNVARRPMSGGGGTVWPAKMKNRWKSSENNDDNTPACYDAMLYYGILCYDMRDIPT